MIHKLDRRIKALERAQLGRCNDRRLIAGNALSSAFSWHSTSISRDLESFFSAIGAEREGRDLSEEESAARRAYEEALTRKCRTAGYPSSKGFKGALSIGDALSDAMAMSFFREELELAMRAGEAEAEGRSATQEESAALQAINVQRSRLIRLAAIPPESTPEDSLL